MKGFKLRLLAIWRVITNRNFILIGNIKEIQKEGQPARQQNILFRTDYSSESDLLSLVAAVTRKHDEHFDAIGIEADTK